MPVRVADLVADPALRLRLHTPASDVERPISWVHVSELADPTPFLEGGELLLTTGLGLRDTEPAEDYVGRLLHAGVVGLGFGTGVGRDAVPPELVAAAEAGGLTLLEVPRETPFIALSRRVANALAADEYASVARTASAQLDLTRAALAPGAPATVVERLARQVGGWVLLMDAGGAVLHAAPATAGRRTAGLRVELDHLRGLRPPAGAALSAPEETVLVQSLGSGARTRGFLAVGRPGPFPAVERHVVNAAVLLLTLGLEQSRALDRATTSLRAALLRLLLAGQVAAVGEILAHLGEELPAEPLRAVTVLGEAGSRAAAADVATGTLGSAGAPVFAGELDDALVLVAPDSAGLLARLGTLAERVPGLAFGVSAAVAWPRLTEGVRQARQAAEHGRSRGAGVTAFPDLAAPGLTELMGAAPLRAFADALLAPLAVADRAAAGDLVRSLRVWLAHHGQWEPAAADLGVHRHTLRKRIRRAGELLQRDLDAPGVRAELWLALHAASS